MILVGQESNWYSETPGPFRIPNPDGTLTTGTLGYHSTNPSNFEFVAGGDIEAAKRKFTERAQGLSATSGQRIQFQQVKATPGGWKTRFRYLTPAARWGLPKGGTNAGETTRAAAVREFAEEIGMNVRPDLLGGALAVGDYDFYPWTVNEAGRNAILTAVAGRHARHYSEMFDVKFMPLADVLALPLNAKSREAVEGFQATLMGGGSRKVSLSRRLSRRAPLSRKDKRRKRHTRTARKH
jgi:8-oxo-dGTP pyrophosphatase MutT (NUDIX family)